MGPHSLLQVSSVTMAEYLLIVNTHSAIPAHLLHLTGLCDEDLSARTALGASPTMLVLNKRRWKATSSFEGQGGAWPAKHQIWIPSVFKLDFCS